MVLCLDIVMGQQIKGFCIDKTTQKPISYGYVMAKQSAVLTNEDGKFILPCTFNGYDTITFKAIGYKIERKPVRCGETNVLIALEPEALQMSSVVITAGKFAQKIEDVTVSMQIMEGKKIAQNNSLSADDALDRMPGVNVINGQINIRGGSGFSYGAGSRALVMVDDMPLLSADAGDVKWNYIPIENVEQVEVLKGASSALQGSSALSGVVNFRTKRSSSTPQTMFSTFFGVYNAPQAGFVNPAMGSKTPLFQTGFSASDLRKIGKHELVTGLFGLYDKGYRVGEHFKRIRASLNYRYLFNNTKWAAGLNLTGMRDSTGSFLFWDDKSRAFFPDTGSNNLILSYRYNIDPWVTHYVGTNKYTYKGRIFGTQNINNNALLSSNAYLIYNEFQAQHQPKIKTLDQLVITEGIVNIYNIIQGGNLYGNRFSNNNAAYLQADAKKGRLNVSFGVRAETFAMSNQFLRRYMLFRSGVNYKVSKATWLRGSWGQGYRNPSVAERYVFAQSGGLLVLPNPSLIPEKGRSFEVGLRQLYKFQGLNGFIDVAYFNTKYFNLIEFIFGLAPPAPNMPAVQGFQSKNITDANIKGVEVTAGAAYTIGKTNLTFQGGYTYLNPIDMKAPDTSATSKFLKYRYKHLVRLDVAWVKGKWNIGANIRYNSFMVNIDPVFNQAIDGVESFRNQFNKGDLIIDMRGGYAITNKLKCAIVLRNILNRMYMIVPGNIGQPRTQVLQLQWQIQ